MAKTMLDMAYESGFRLNLATFGMAVVVTLRGGATTFPLRVLLGRRGSTDRTEELTQGIDQGRMRLRFACDDWAAAAPRAPEIGDVVTLESATAPGRRLAFSEAPQTRYVNNKAMIYLCDVAG